MVSLAVSGGVGIADVAEVPAGQPAPVVAAAGASAEDVPGGVGGIDGAGVLANQPANAAEHAEGAGAVADGVGMGDDAVFVVADQPAAAAGGGGASAVPGSVAIGDIAAVCMC